MGGKSLGIVSVLALLLVTVGSVESAAARGRGGNGAAQKRAMMIAAAQQQLAMGQQMLSAAETAASEAQSEVSAATDRIEGARKSISDAKSGASESTKSQKSIEAEILAAQSDKSEYAQASLALLGAQEELKSAQERVLSDEKYLANKAGLLKEENHAGKVAKLQRDTLAADTAYSEALDKAKAARLVLNRVKSDLFKANSDWVAAASASKEAAAEESKANIEASKGAFKKMPAVRNLREARAAVEDARAVVADAQMKLRMLGAQPAKGTPTTPYSSTSNSK
jgi:chromosome segregation ATPase